MLKSGNLYRFFNQELGVPWQGIWSASSWCTHGICTTCFELASLLGCQMMNSWCIYDGMFTQFHSTDIILGTLHGQAASGRVVRGLVHRIVLLFNPWLRVIGFFPCVPHRACNRRQYFASLSFFFPHIFLLARQGLWKISLYLLPWDPRKASCFLHHQVSLFAD